MDSNMTFGSPKYVSPEVCLNVTKMKKSSQDVWSMGVILYEMIYKKFPFRLNEKNSKLQAQDIEKFYYEDLEIEFGKTDDPKLIGLVKKMLESDPIKRVNWKGIKKYLIDVMER